MYNLILEIDSFLEENEQQIQQQTVNFEKAKLDLAKVSREIEKRQRQMDKSITKKSLLEQKKEAALLHIRELGVLPEEAFAKHDDTEQETV